MFGCSDGNCQISRRREALNQVGCGESWKSQIQKHHTHLAPVDSNLSENRVFDIYDILSVCLKNARFSSGKALPKIPNSTYFITTDYPYQGEKQVEIPHRAPVAEFAKIQAA